METNEYADWTIAPNTQDDLAFLFGVDMEEVTDSRLRLLVTYIESPAAIERKEFKQLEFWMFKKDGAKLAKVLTRLFGCDTKERAADYFRPVRHLFEFGQSLTQIVVFPASTNISKHARTAG